LHWKRVPSDEDNKVFGKVQAFVAGSPVNMQVMIKDSQKYSATGGWGFGDFTDGKPADEAKHKTRFGCHEPAKDHDFVFTRYAP
jgi:Cytochrome P460